MSLVPLSDKNAAPASVQFVALTPVGAVIDMDSDPVVMESTVVQHQGQDRLIWWMVFTDVGTSVSGCARVGEANVRIGASYHLGGGPAVASGSSANRC